MSEVKKEEAFLDLEITAEQARESEAWWAEFVNEHTEEIAKLPQKEFEEWRNQVNDFLKLSRGKRSREEIAEAIIAAWGGKPIQKGRKSNRKA